MTAISLSVKPTGYELIPVYPRREWQTHTGARMVNAVSGSRWQLRLMFRVGEDDRTALLADLMALMEPDGYWIIYFASVLGYKRKGTIAITTEARIPSVSNAQDAVTPTFNPSTDAGYIERGDLVTVYGELKGCRGRTSTGGTLRFWPAFRGVSRNFPAPGFPLIIDNPWGFFFLVGNPPPIVHRPLKKGQMIEFSLTLEERLHA